jgi:hypothetical protein
VEFEEWWSIPLPSDIISNEERLAAAAFHARDAEIQCLRQALAAYDAIEIMSPGQLARDFTIARKAARQKLEIQS